MPETIPRRLYHMPFCAGFTVFCRGLSLRLLRWQLNIFYFLRHLVLMEHFRFARSYIWPSTKKITRFTHILAFSFLASERHLYWHLFQLLRQRHIHGQVLATNLLVWRPPWSRYANKNKLCCCRVLKGSLGWRRTQVSTEKVSFLQTSSNKIDFSKDTAVEFFHGRANGWII